MALPILKTALSVVVAVSVTQATSLDSAFADPSDRVALSKSKSGEFVTSYDDTTSKVTGSVRYHIKVLSNNGDFSEVNAMIRRSGGIANAASEDAAEGEFMTLVVNNTYFVRAGDIKTVEFKSESDVYDSSERRIGTRVIYLRGYKLDRSKGYASFTPVELEIQTETFKFVDGERVGTAPYIHSERFQIVPGIAKSVLNDAQMACAGNLL